MGRALLHIVASCADRKRGDGGHGLRLRDFAIADPFARLDRWWKELLCGDMGTMPARDLYVGPYWSAVRSLSSCEGAGHFDLRLWVASAGYGLVPFEALLRHYSATFSAGMPDSVIRRQDLQRGFTLRHWWNALAGKQGPVPDGPRTLSRVATRNRRAQMMVIGSPAYVSALEGDLVDAVSALGNERLVIITGDPGPKSKELRASWVPSTARLLTELGGALPSLHARLARRILDEAPKRGLEASELRRRWEAIADRAPLAKRPVRAVSSDSEVKRFIRGGLRASASLTHTRALRDFRAGGRACEQGRFRALFSSIAQELPK